MQIHIGIDDTDSKKGGCTTYIGARLVEKFTKMDVSFTDYPNIIRLNPNIPYKTRGNAAVALRLEINDVSYSSIVRTVLDEIEQISHFGEKGTEPAIIFLSGRPNAVIKRFSTRALQEVVPERDARKLIESSMSCAAAYGGTLGFVGALAAVGQTLEGDHTYELVAYRQPQNCGTPRKVDEDSVRRMDKLTSPMTFNNYDYTHNRTLITPHGPDPVLLGVRGETPRIVLEAFHMLAIAEPVERWVIFRTNHGTDAHLQFRINLRLRPNTPVVLKGLVADKPITIRGGHTFFTLRYPHGTIRCAAFEPTGEMRRAVMKLLPRDEITVYGGVRQRTANSEFTINLEKMLVRKVARDLRTENPTCPTCSKRLKSSGNGQGFRCDRCFATFPHAHKRIIGVARAIEPGLYVPSLKSHRHLTKPISRYGLEKVWKKRAPSGAWHEP